MKTAGVLAVALGAACSSAPPIAAEAPGQDEPPRVVGEGRPDRRLSPKSPRRPQVRKCQGPVRVLRAVTDPDDMAELLHGARLPPLPSPPGQLGLFA
jgi:hypothetical protein